MAPITVTDAAWVTIETPVACDGFKLWSDGTPLLIGDKNDVNFQDTLAAGVIEDCTTPARGGSSGALFRQGERVIDIKAATAGSFTAKVRFYGQRGF